MGRSEEVDRGCGSPAVSVPMQTVRFKPIDPRIEARVREHTDLGATPVLRKNSILIALDCTSPRGDNR